MRSVLCGVLSIACAACGSVVSNEQSDAGSAATVDAGASRDGALGVPGDGAAAFKKVFVTTAAFPASFGGVSFADKMCGAAAAATAAHLDGTWLAWISGPSPADVTGRFTHATVPYVLVDGTTVVANDWDDLVHGTIRHAIDHDQLGALLAHDGTGAWTATDSTGVYVASDCGRWTSMSGSAQAVTGDPTQTSESWTQNNAFVAGACSGTAHLYCFEQ